MKHESDTYAYMFFRASNWGGEDRNKCLNETEPIYKVGYKAADYFSASLKLSKQDATIYNQ
jgi:hypothetical protein